MLKAAISTIETRDLEGEETLCKMMALCIPKIGQILLLVSMVGRQD